MNQGEPFGSQGRLWRTCVRSVCGMRLDRGTSALELAFRGVEALSA